MTIEQNMQVVIKFNNEFYNKGNKEVTNELLTSDFVNHAAPNAVNDANTMIQFITMVFHKAFSNRQILIKEIFGSGDKVCTRVSITATHTGEFMGRHATGKKVIMNLISIDTLKDGKISEHWSQNDFMQALQND